MKHSLAFAKVEELDNRSNIICIKSSHLVYGKQIINLYLPALLLDGAILILICYGLNLPLLV